MQLGPVHHLVIAAAAARLLLPPPAAALEKRAARWSPPESEWNAGASCSIQYWNTCVGWVWIWSGWSPGDQFGVNYEACGTHLSSLEMAVFFDAPCAMYGFEASVEVYAADTDGCPTGPLLGSVPFLPGCSASEVFFSPPVAVPASFVALVHMGPEANRFASFRTDFDAQGPTGPQGCGTCFPKGRETRSYYYGRPDAAYCPGLPLTGPVCDVELIWTARMVSAIGVEASSWSKVKGLYR